MCILLFPSFPPPFGVVGGCREGVLRKGKDERKHLLKATRRSLSVSARAEHLIVEGINWATPRKTMSDKIVMMPGVFPEWSPTAGLGLKTCSEALGGGASGKSLALLSMFSQREELRVFTWTP